MNWESFWNFVDVWMRRVGTGITNLIFALIVIFILYDPVMNIYRSTLRAWSTIVRRTSSGPMALEARPLQSDDTIKDGWTFKAAVDSFTHVQEIRVKGISTYKRNENKNSRWYRAGDRLYDILCNGNTNYLNEWDVIHCDDPADLVILIPEEERGSKHQVEAWVFVKRENRELESVSKLVNNRIE